MEIFYYFFVKIFVSFAAFLVLLVIAFTSLAKIRVEKRFLVKLNTAQVARDITLTSIMCHFDINLTCLGIFYSYVVFSTYIWYWYRMTRRLAHQQNVFGEQNIRPERHLAAEIETKVLSLILIRFVSVRVILCYIPVPVSRDLFRYSFLFEFCEFYEMATIRKC